MDYNLKRQDSFVSRDSVRSRESLDKASRRKFCGACGRLSMPFVSCSYCAGRQAALQVEYFGRSGSGWGRGRWSTAARGD
jgi:hypothetical protein